LTETVKPLVSVIMPAYNAEKYIAEAIESVVAQSYENWELIVIDDCSADNTAEIARSFAEKDGRIRLIKNNKNIGAAETRNKGLDLAKGEYIALLDSDDVWLPEKTEKQLELAEQTEADIVYCSYAMIDENGAKIHKEYVVPESTDFDSMLEANVIGCSTAMVRAAVLKEHPFSETYYHEDYVLWMELLRDGCAAKGLPQVLAHYRILKNSRSNNKLNSAVQRWIIYRDCFEMTMLESLRCFSAYAVNGLKKHLG